MQIGSKIAYYKNDRTPVTLYYAYNVLGNVKYKLSKIKQMSHSMIESEARSWSEA